MTLRERIAEDLKAAMKAGDRVRLETLRTMRAVLLEREIEKRGAAGGITGEDEVAALTTAAKKRKESIELFTKGGRPELAAQEQAELAIIQEYLPRQMSPDEIAAVIRTVIAATGASGAGDFGRVMPLVMKEVKGKADGKLVQELVRKSLGAAG
ncbi:MAG TPA: GatB/YqeY domain-containing protein [Bacteroidota bacterium]|nr:GatB/YqeY domain-containing protein [Bacteroidota bacterium]